MSLNKNNWPTGMYSRETWQKDSQQKHTNVPRCRSTSMRINELSGKRKCLYGQRSFSESEAEFEEQFELSLYELPPNAHKSDSEDSQTDGDMDKETFGSMCCASATCRADVASWETETVPGLEGSFAVDNDDNNEESLFQHTYMNLRDINDSSEGSNSFSTKNSSNSSNEVLQNVSDSFQNEEYMRADSCRRYSLSTRTDCVYAIPKCNCILAKKIEPLYMNDNIVMSNLNDLSDQNYDIDCGNQDSAGYVCMDAYIQKKAIHQTVEKGKYHFYENENKCLDDNGNLTITKSSFNQQTLKWPNYDDKMVHNVYSNLDYSDKLAGEHGVALVDETLCADYKTETCKRISSQSFRRKSRVKQRPNLDRNLLKATLAKQKVDNFPLSTDLANRTEAMTEAIDDLQILSDTLNARKTEPNSLVGRPSQKRVYIPNLHPKLVKFLITSSVRRRQLEQDMIRKGFEIVWPQTEEGVLYLEPSDNKESCTGMPTVNIDDDIEAMFYSRLRNYFLDDSICAAKEICEALTALLAVTPLVTNCTIYNENMNWVIIGDKDSVEDCKCQLIASIKFLEMRLEASGTKKVTKEKFLTKEAARIILESKILDKFRTHYKTLKVDFGDDFEYIKFRGDIKSVESGMQELHTFLKNVKGFVYKCLPLIRRLLNNTKGKSSLKELLRSHGLVGAWRIVEDTCIVYGTSLEDVQSVMKIFNRILVSDEIKLSNGQNELMQSRIGKTEIKDVTKRYEGLLEVDIADHVIEIACALRIREEVCSRLKKFLNRNEVIRTTQEVDNNLFKLLQHFHYDKLTNMQQRCKTILVEITPFEENSKCGLTLTGRRDFCMIALRELESVLATLTSFEHTIKRVGIIPFLRSEKGRGQMSSLESQNQCIVHFSNGSPISQNKVCVCQYDNKEIIVLHDDINAVTTGLAYIPCEQSVRHTRSRDGEAKPRQLEARECMVSRDKKHVTRYNFFACMPDTEPLGHEVCDAVKTSVGLCLRETTIREMPCVAFSISNPTIGNYPAEYAKIIVETVKEFLQAERRLTKLQRVLFCAKDGLHTKTFIQALECAFGRKTLHVSSSINKSITSASTSRTKITESGVNCTATELHDTQMEKDNSATVEVNLVKYDATSVKADAIFMPARESSDLVLKIPDLNSSVCTIETMREKLQTTFASGLAIGEVVSVKLDCNNCSLAYLAKLGSATTNTAITRKVLKTVMQAVLERCIEDEIEVLAILTDNTIVYLLSDVIFDVLQYFVCENYILERIDIIVDSSDKSSFEHFEEMRKQYYDKMPRGCIEGQKIDDSLFDDNVTKASLTCDSNPYGCTLTSLTNEERADYLSLSEGIVKVEVLMGDITKETTDVIVNSVHGNLDLSASILAKAVSTAGGSEIQTELRSKQNLSSIRREGIVVTGPGKLNCKYIFHVKLKGSIEGWKTVISSCLQLAETQGVKSLSFPALGTGRKGIKPHFFTKAVLKCIRKFSTTNPKSLRDVRIVIFDEAMFYTVLRTANAFRGRKRRSTLKAKIHEMLKKESPKRVEDEARLQVYTAVDNVDNVKRKLDELGANAPIEG